MPADPPEQTDYPTPPSGVSSILAEEMWDAGGLVTHYVEYAQELLDFNQGTGLYISDEDLQEKLEDSEWASVIKMVDCGKECSGCPHGPYLYLAKRVSGSRIKWKYIGPTKNVPDSFLDPEEEGEYSIEETHKQRLQDALDQEKIDNAKIEEMGEVLEPEKALVGGVIQWESDGEKQMGEIVKVTTDTVTVLLTSDLPSSPVYIKKHINDSITNYTPPSEAQSQPLYSGMGMQPEKIAEKIFNRINQENIEQADSPVGPRLIETEKQNLREAFLSYFHEAHFSSFMSWMYNWKLPGDNPEMETYENTFKQSLNIQSPIFIHQDDCCEPELHHQQISRVIHELSKIYFGKYLNDKPVYRGLSEIEFSELIDEWLENPTKEAYELNYKALNNHTTQFGIASAWGSETAVVKHHSPLKNGIVSIHDWLFSGIKTNECEVVIDGDEKVVSSTDIYFSGCKNACLGTPFSNWSINGLKSFGEWVLSELEKYGSNRFTQSQYQTIQKFVDAVQSSEEKELVDIAMSIRRIQNGVDEISVGMPVRFRYTGDTKSGIITNINNNRITVKGSSRIYNIVEDDIMYSETITGVHVKDIQPGSGVEYEIVGSTHTGTVLEKENGVLWVADPILNTRVPVPIEKIEAITNSPSPTLIDVDVNDTVFLKSEESFESATIEKIDLEYGEIVVCFSDGISQTTKIEYALNERPDYTLNTAWKPLYGEYEKDSFSEIKIGDTVKVWYSDGREVLTGDFTQVNEFDEPVISIHAEDYDSVSEITVGLANKNQIIVFKSGEEERDGTFDESSNLNELSCGDTVRFMKNYEEEYRVGKIISMNDSLESVRVMSGKEKMIVLRREIKAVTSGKNSWQNMPDRGMNGFNGNIGLYESIHFTNPKTGKKCSGVIINIEQNVTRVIGDDGTVHDVAFSNIQEKNE